MYRLEKRFTFPMGHRLCNHKGACFNFHGHNYVVLVGLKSTALNDNDMIIDFAHLKEVLNPIFNLLDHAFMINTKDKDMINKLQEVHLKVIPVDYDPTAERMAEELFYAIREKVDVLRRKADNENLDIDYVTVYENENSKATYSLS